MKIDGDIVAALSAQLNYVDLMGLNHAVHRKSLTHANGTRALKENGWRGLDLHEVLRSLELSRQENKILLLLLLKRSDWIEILFLLDKEKLLRGLRFFSKAKLLRLIFQLPKRWILKMLLHVMSMEDLAKKLPTHEILFLLKSPKILVRHLVQAFQSMDPKFLSYLLLKILGRHMSHLAHAEQLHILGNIKKRQIMEGLKFLPYKALAPLVLFFMKRDPELLHRLSGALLFKLFDKMTKPTLMESMRVLPKDLLIQFLSLLPDKMLIQVAAQIDEKQLHQFLLSRHSNLLTLLGELLVAAA